MEPTLARRQMAELSSFSTAIVSDALDEASITGVLHGPRAQRSGQGRVIGRAMTVRLEPRTHDPAAYRFGGGVGRPLERVLQTMSLGDVVVMDLGGTTTASAWGGLASRLALRRGVRGTVLFGPCRDVEEIREIGYPVWSLGTYPRRSRNDFTFGSIQEPVHVSGVTVSPNDIIIADETGVVCIPADDVQRVLELAREIAAQEAKLLMSLDEDAAIPWDQI